MKAAVSPAIRIEPARAVPRDAPRFVLSFLEARPASVSARSHRS
jgi:hypothetical protein